MHNKTPAGSTSPCPDPTTTRRHGTPFHLAPPLPAGVAAAPARVSVCDIFCTSSPAPSSASLPAVADSGSTHPHPDRNICIYIDDMMMGARSLELELRSPASREHFLINYIYSIWWLLARSCRPGWGPVFRTS